MAQAPPVRDLTMWLSDLTYKIPSEYKASALWMAQALFYIKRDGASFPLLDSKRWARYTNLENMIIDKELRQELINLIDPKTPMGAGGTAEYFASDWKEIPLAQHIINQLRAKLDRIGIENQLQVNEIDKYAKGQRQREKDRILYQREFRNLINELNKTTNIPPIKESQSPYSYIRSLSQQKEGQQGESDVNENIVDYIKGQISDSQDMTLFMSYVYKGDIEKAFELALQHYMINMNKWRISSQPMDDDLVKFNLCSGIMYTDMTSGRGTVEYIHPCILNTSAFHEMNGEDITWWWYEKDIPFSDFVRKFGMTLNDEQLKEVFELNKAEGGRHGLKWEQRGSFKGSMAKIRIGHMEILTQDAEKFSQKYSANGAPVWERKPLSWIPDKRTPNKYKSEMKTKMYNVWYSCDYVPPPSTRFAKNSQSDWAWQAQYMFNIGKNIDMYRYGVDMRYAKSTLVVYRDTRPSVFDILEAFMPKIRMAWYQFQNCIVNDFDAVGIADEFLGSAMKAVDEANNQPPGLPGDPDRQTGPNRVDVKLETWKMMKQGHSAFLKMTDKSGNPIPLPQNMVISVKNGQLEKAEHWLKVILELYQLTTTSIAQSDIAQGQDPKPRTPIAGITASLKASELASWHIEKAKREVMIMYGERFIQYILYIIKDHKKYGFNERWQELQNVLGLANSMALESIEDYRPEDIGLTVSLEDVSAMKNYYIELTNQYLHDGKIQEEDVEMIVSSIMQNYKYGAVLLTLSAKKIKKEMAAKQQLEHEQAMQLKQEDLKIAQALNAGKAAGKDQNIKTQGMVDEMLQNQDNQFKHGSMMEQSDKRKNNRLEENAQKAELEKQKKQSEITQQ